MPPTLDYNMKGCMVELTKDCRWNVLTVLILHANIRNRCWVGMDTIALMATNNNLKKATRAKKWLQNHGAFTLVPFDKRVEKEELSLAPRQHLYQLTGKVTIEGVEYSYLYHTTPEVVPIDNNEYSPNVSTIDNINVSTIEIINGSNRSISNIRNSKPARKTSKPDTATLMARELIQVWSDAVGRFGSSDTRLRMKQAAELLSWSVPATKEEVLATVLERLPIPRQGDYEFGYLIDDIRERRAKAELARTRSKQREVSNQDAIEKAEFHIAMMLGGQEVNDDSAA